MTRRCRVCGCTDAEACELAHAWPGHRPYAEPARRAASVVAVRQTCAWAGSDLCTRCHTLAHLTLRQIGELDRIRRLHDVQVIRVPTSTGLDHGRTGRELGGLVLRVTRRSLDERDGHRHTITMRVPA